MILPNMTFESYLEAPGLSQSALKMLADPGGAAKLKWGVKTPTKAQRFGTLIHTAILQADMMDLIYAPLDTDRLDKRTEEYKEAEREAMGRIVVKKKDFDEACRIRDAVYRWSSVARELLRPGDPTYATEQSFFYHDPASGYLCKGRADAVNTSYRAILDVKSTTDASREGFRYACKNYGYAIQNVHYTDGWPLAGGIPMEYFVFIAVEKEPPYLTAAYVLEPHDLEEARIERARLIDIYATCDRTNDWPGYPAGLQTLSLTHHGESA